MSSRRFILRTVPRQELYAAEWLNIALLAQEPFRFFAPEHSDWLTGQIT